MRRLAQGLAVALAVPLVLLIASVLLPLVPGPGRDLSGPPAQRIGLLQGPLHTDILFPLTPDVRRRFGFAAFAGVPVDDPGGQWLAFGWGARGFYTTAGTYGDITATAAWRAATGDAAVVRLDVLGPQEPRPNLRFLDLSQAQFDTLLDTALAAMDGTARLAVPGLTGTDAFFPAQGRFHGFRTCNVWLGQTFRAAGIPFGLWTPANWSVRIALDRFLPQDR